MYTKEAVRAIGADDTLSPDQIRRLDEDGFVIVEEVISKDAARRMADEFERLHAAEAKTGGGEVHVEPGARRLSNIFNKSTVFDPLLAIGPALAASRYLLGEIKVHGANIRDPVKGHGHQQLHTDVPKKFPDDWWVVNSMILFDDMTMDNGPTRVIPGSHRWAPVNVPVVNQGDWEPGPLSPRGRRPRPGRSRRPLSRRDLHHRAGPLGGHHEFLRLACRHPEEDRRPAPSHPPHLHPPRPAPAARPARPRHPRASTSA